MIWFVLVYDRGLVATLYCNLGEVFSSYDSKA